TPPRQPPLQPLPANSVSQPAAAPGPLSSTPRYTTSGTPGLLGTTPSSSNQCSSINGVASPLITDAPFTLALARHAKPGEKRGQLKSSCGYGGLVHVWSASHLTN